MGISAIGQRIGSSFGVVKSNAAAIKNAAVTLVAEEYNRLADALIEVQQAIGTTVSPQAGSFEARIVSILARIVSAESLLSSLDLQVGRTAPVVFSPISGTIAMALSSHGRSPEFALNGQAAFDSITGYSNGASGKIAIYQSGSGGHTVAFGGNWRATNLWQNTGNVAGCTSWVFYDVDSSGRPWITQVTPYRPA